jgi:hypothetical protein
MCAINFASQSKIRALAATPTNPLTAKLTLRRKGKATARPSRTRAGKKGHWVTCWRSGEGLPSKLAILRVAILAHKLQARC